MTSCAFLHFQDGLHKLFFSGFHETAFRTFYAGRSDKPDGFRFSILPGRFPRLPRSMPQNKTPGITYNAHYKDWSFKKLPSKNWQSIVHKTIPKPPASVEWIFRTFRQSSRRRPPPSATHHPGSVRTFRGVHAPELLLLSRNVRKISLFCTGRLRNCFVHDARRYRYRRVFQSSF